MRYRDLIEAPIADIDFHGDMNTPGTFRKDDLKKFNDPAWKERVLKLFRNAPVDIYLHIINGDDQGRITRRGPTWTDKVYTNDVSKYVGIQSARWAESIIGPVETEGRITVLLFQNEGGARVGLTPWMVGHRIAHCFVERNDREMNDRLRYLSRTLISTLTRLVNALIPLMGLPLIDLGSEKVAEIAKHLSTFRSARTENLNNSGEYLVELFTEYLIKGKVEFQREWVGDAKREKVLTDVQQAILDASKTYFRGDRFADLEYPERADELFQQMKGNPLRPKTRRQFYAVIEHMIDNELYDMYPKAVWTAAETIHYHLDKAEETLNKTFGEILDEGMGKVVVL